MAYETGTATNYTDFWTKLKTFLTSNAALVTAGQNWTIVWTAPGGAPNSTDVVLKGPGLASSDEVFIGLRLVVDVPGDKFAIHMCGMTGILDGATEFNAHVNCTPTYVRMFLSAAAMPYWFVANGRRFVAAAKISTVYECMYGGLMLPYSLPSAYPYPLFIGGSSGQGSASVDWRSTAADHTLFHKPRYTATIPTNAWLLSPSSSWLRCGDSGSQASTNVFVAPDFYADQGYVMNPTFGNAYYGYRDIKDRIAPCYGGAYALAPLTLIEPTPAIQTYGLLQGVYAVPGVGNSAENIVSFNGVNHLVLQNVFRTSTGEYLAVALEA